MTLCAARVQLKGIVVGQYKADKNLKFDHKINRTNSQPMTQDILITVLLSKQFEKALYAFDKIVEQAK